MIKNHMYELNITTSMVIERLPYGPLSNMYIKTLNYVETYSTYFGVGLEPPIQSINELQNMRMYCIVIDSGIWTYLNCIDHL